MVNEINNVYGKLTVIARAPRPEGRPAGAYWLCQCECGNQKVVRGVELRTGGTRSCGCLYGKHSIKNEIGNRYGKLVVLEQTDQREYGSVCWLCKCDCGNTVVVAGDALRSGQTKSCGCLIKEKSREANMVDRTGQKYHKLTALEIDEEASRTHPGHGLYWKCRCDCGNIVTVSGSNLVTGGVKSCGCLKTSYGEEYIARLLEENHVPYVKEYCFPDLYGHNKVALRYDFAIFDDNHKLLCLIEYDGEQHFHEVPMWGGAEGLELRRQNDKKKNQYCIDNNIKLIRIPYYKLEDFNIEVLRGELNNELS